MGGRGARKCQGLKMDGGGGEGRFDIDWCTPLLPQEPIHFCVCTLCAGLNEGWGGGWNGVSTEASPTVHSLVLSLFFFFFFFWMIHPDCHVRCDWMNEWMTGEKIIRLSLAFNSLQWEGNVLGVGAAITFHSWGRKLKHASAWFGVFNVWRESSTDGLCWSDVLSPSAGRPVSSCLCMCPGTVGTTSLAQPNVELQRLRVPNNRPYFTLACCCCHALGKPIIKMNVLSKCCIASAAVYQCLDCAGNQVKWGEYLSCGCEDVRLIAKANRSM